MTHLVIVNQLRDPLGRALGTLECDGGHCKTVLYE
jgi:hypothetical protein